MMKAEIIDAVYDLVDEIKDKKEYKRLLQLKDIIENDELIIKLISNFNKAKTKYMEAAKYGRHHPDIKEVQTSLARCKEELFTNEIVSEYKKLEKEIQNYLDSISREIAQCVSPKIKYPNEMGLINKH